MVGGEREGRVRLRNANATSSGGVHHPATAPVVAASGGSGNGNVGEGGGGGLAVEKVKFTVSVRGHQWSSARHVNETLEEFASAIERNARRLAFIDNDDSIQRLQLAYIDGSEPEDLDVDATLGDLIICIGDKQLFAIVNSTQPTPPPPIIPRRVTPTTRPDSESTLQIANAKATNCNVSVAAPSAVPKYTAGFQSLASAVLGQLPNQSIQCPHGAKTNVALLALQLRAFSTPGDALPTPASCGHDKAPKVTNPVANTAKRSVSGATSYGNSKEKSSSSSHSSGKVHNSLAPQSGDGEGVDSELPNGGTELVVEVKRRSKSRLEGGGTHQLKMSDLSKYFHLNLVNAAKKLGVSQTTLKKACRTFELKRWPGRKVRSLESTIHGLQHVIAKGEGSGLKDSTADHMRSEVFKLQHERDQFVHGTPAQVAQKMHSPGVRSAVSYKLVYPFGWRSRARTIILDTRNPNKRASGLALPTTRNYRKAVKGNQLCKRGRPRKVPPPSKDSPSQPTPPWGNGGPRDTVMKDCDIEGLLPEIHDNIHVEGNEASETALLAKNGTPETTSGTEREQGVVFEEEITIAERSPKRLKREPESD